MVDCNDLRRNICRIINSFKRRQN